MNNTQLLCSDTLPTFLGIFDFSIAPELLYYAYIPITFISLTLGIFIWIQNKKSPEHLLFLLLTIVFSLFLFNDIVLWTAVPVSTIYFSWSLALVLRTLLIVLVLLFTYRFGLKKSLNPYIYLLGGLLCAPLFILAPTKLNVVAFDLANCEGVDGLLWKYLYLLEVLSVLTATVTSLYYLSIHFLKPDAKTEANKQKILLFFGTAFFLSIYFSAEYIGALWNAYEINLLGPAGMLLFLITITYLIVRYKAFEIKLAAAQVLVLGLIMLVASQLFFVETALTTLLATITLILSSIGGYFLVRSVKREINQREQIEQLASGLEIANDQLKVLDKMKSEFVSIASHQLRSPLTAIRGYSSMLLEGSFGPMPDKAKDAVERISEASRFMASSVEDYLNVSRIQAGNMKYEYSDFNLKDLASRVADDTRQIAIKKGLLLTFKTDMKKTGIVHADIGKTRQIIDNLINNALKYTPKGTIEVLVRDDAKLKKIFVEISDSGIGMSEKTIANMFGKFERASNANEVNVTGTGLGLYIARKMAREMGGDVTAHSQGEGKGSMFRIELALMM